MENINKDELERIYTWLDYADHHGSHYPGMSYEDGIRSVLETLEGLSSVDDLL